VLGEINSRENNLFEAEWTFNKVLELDSRQALAYLGLSHALASQGMLKKAEFILKQAVDVDPASLKIRL